MKKRVKKHKPRHLVPLFKKGGMHEDDRPRTKNKRSRKKAKQDLKEYKE